MMSGEYLQISGTIQTPIGLGVLEVLTRTGDSHLREVYKTSNFVGASRSERKKEGC